MKKVIMLDGGAGRIIAAIPALKKFINNNPDTDTSIIVGGWDSLLWGIPELQDITFSPDTKGVFENVFLDADEVISPEPYRHPGYYTQKLSLAEAFDALINNTDDHSDLENPTLVLNKREEFSAAKFISEVKSNQSKQKTIVIQPFGRSASREDENIIIDDSSRSLEPETYLKLVKKLSTKYNLIFFGEEEMFLPGDTYTAKTKVDLRLWAAFIESADYFVGCDSIGQHMARAFDKPGTVIIGSTYPVNTSYPDFFNIFEKDSVKKYSPIRISGFDGHMADRYNDRVMEFSDEEIDKLYDSIVSDIDKKVK